MESRSRGVLDTRLRGFDERSCFHASKHAIADREGVVLLAAGFLAPAGGGHLIGEVPRAELIGPAWVCRQPQLEAALRLTRQIQDHDAVGGPVGQGDRPSEHKVAVVVYDGIFPFEFGVACDIFGYDYADAFGVLWYRMSICGPAPWVTVEPGFRMQVPCGLEALHAAETVVVPSTQFPDRVPDDQRVCHLLRLHVVLVPQLHFHQLARAQCVIKSAYQRGREAMLPHVNGRAEMVCFGAQLCTFFPLQFLILPCFVMNVRTSIGVPFQ